MNESPKELVERLVATKIEDFHEWDAARESFRKSIVQMIIGYPWFGFLLVSLTNNATWLKSNSDPVKTMATDGKNLFIWPPFSHGLPHKFRIGVQLHELLHIILFHPDRAKGYRKDLANIAMDYSVNLYVNDAGKECEGIDKKTPIGPDLYEKMAFYIPKEGMLYDERFRLPTGDPMPWEEIYKILLEEEDPNKAYPQPALGDHSLWDPENRIPNEDGEVDDSPFDRQAVLDMIREATLKTKDTKDAGKMPGGLKRLVDEYLDPPLPWDHLLQNYLTQVQGDFSWAPPDIRFEDPMPWPSDEYDLDDIVMTIDTSGSMSEEEVGKSISQCRSVLRSFPGARGWLCMCDAEVQHWAPIENRYLFKERHGYGGTGFRPPFDHIHDLVQQKGEYLAHNGKLQRLKPKIMVYFTDGYGEFPDPGDKSHHVDYDVIWVITNQQVDAPAHDRYTQTRLKSVRAQ